MTFITKNASVRKFEQAETVNQSRKNFVTLFNGLVSTKELRNIFLFATEGPDVGLVVVMDCDIYGLQNIIVIDGSVFTSANMQQIRKIIKATDKYRFEVENESLQVEKVGKEIPKVIYATKRVQQIDDTYELPAAVEAFMKKFNNSPAITPSSKKFLRLFKST